MVLTEQKMQIVIHDRSVIAARKFDDISHGLKSLHEGSGLPC